MWPHPSAGRRHTLSHHTHSPEHVPLIPRYPETTADIQWALNRATVGKGESKPHTVDRYKEKQITVYHNVSGQVVEASGLKGELGMYAIAQASPYMDYGVTYLNLWFPITWCQTKGTHPGFFPLCPSDHMELYVKVRLNTRPSYQRQQKFGRGPVVHKTRVLRGSHNPQWREDFMVGGRGVSCDQNTSM